MFSHKSSMTARGVFLSLSLGLVGFALTGGCPPNEGGANNAGTTLTTFEFPTTGDAVIAIDQAGELAVLFGADQNTDEANINQFSIATTVSDINAIFDASGQLTTSNFEGQQLDITDNGDGTFDYLITVDGVVVADGQNVTLDATLDFNEFAAKANHLAQGNANDVGLAVQECSIVKPEDFASEVLFACADAGTRERQNCYAACMALSAEFMRSARAFCTVGILRGRLRAQELADCQENNLSSDCHKLAQASERVLTYMRVMWSVQRDIAQGLMTQESCPFGDITGGDGDCRFVSLDVSADCPELAGVDPNDIEDPNEATDPNDANDPNDAGDPNTAGDPNSGGDPNAADPNSVPDGCGPNSLPVVNPECFNVVNITSLGTVTASSVYNNQTAQFGVGRAVDGFRGTSWFSDGNSDGNTEEFRWRFTDDGGCDIYIRRIEIDPETFEANGQVGGQFGFAQILIRVFDANGNLTYSSSTMSLAGFKVDVELTLPATTIGEAVVLTLIGHQDPICGGFDELRVFGFELKTEAAE